jgi:hypothetical protein
MFTIVRNVAPEPCTPTYASLLQIANYNRASASVWRIPINDPRRAGSSIQQSVGRVPRAHRDVR